ncbi:hypothetical protein BGZ47_007429 [Haplosporangium gracile]|nr:hypothetical protein BGZ47_007429 [Haplosporangium gracile]
MINSTIRAIRVEEYGDASVLKSIAVPRPVPQKNQVLVKVAYAGINFGDINFSDISQGSGFYPTSVPFTAGGEGSGEISRRTTGSLIHAAVGGMGLLLTQLSHRLGTHVIGAVSSNEKAALARANGADHIVVVSTNKSGPYESLEKRVRELINGQGVHVVYDSIGQATFELCLEIVRRLGTLVLFGSTSGNIPPQSLTVRISKVYEPEEARQAHLDLEGRRTTGKLLLKIN